MILTFGLDSKVLEDLETLVEKYNEQIRPISPEEALYTAGHLAGVESADHRKFKKEYYPEDIDFILFAGLSKENLYGFLKDAANLGYQFPHKAVLTETTKNWPFSYLLGHIAEEHQMVKAYNALGKKLKPLEDHEDPRVKALIQEAKDLPKKTQDLGLKDVQALDAKVDELLKELKNS